MRLNHGTVREPGRVRISGLVGGVMSDWQYVRLNVLQGALGPECPDGDTYAARLINLFPTLNNDRIYNSARDRGYGRGIRGGPHRGNGFIIEDGRMAVQGWSAPSDPRPPNPYRRVRSRAQRIVVPDPNH